MEEMEILNKSKILTKNQKKILKLAQDTTTATHFYLHETYASMQRRFLEEILWGKKIAQQLSSIEMGEEIRKSLEG
jgi:hypothetical protein